MTKDSNMTSIPFSLKLLGLSGTYLSQAVWCEGVFGGAELSNITGVMISHWSDDITLMWCYHISNTAWGTLLCEKNWWICLQTIEVCPQTRMFLCNIIDTVVSLPHDAIMLRMSMGWSWLGGLPPTSQLVSVMGEFHEMGVPLPSLEDWQP